MSYTIQEIEDALVAAMQTDDGVSGACKTLESYSGDAADLVGQIEQLTVPLPAVWAVYNGSAFNESASNSFDDEMKFVLLVAAKDLRGRVAAAQGVYEILESLKTLFIGKNLGLDINPLRPISIDPVVVTNRLAIYGFILRTYFSMD